MNLDINTPRGQITLADELKAVEIFLDENPLYQFCHTNKASAAHADGILVCNGTMESLVLTSCRYKCTMTTFRTSYNNEFILTWRKLALGALICRRLHLQLVGFLYIVKDDTLVVQHLYDPSRRPGQRWITPIRRDRTLTQASVNGGRAKRLNAFIKMDKASILKRR